MRATLVADLLTSCAAADYVRSIRGGLETLMGKTPSNAHVAVLTAQSALESGRWRAMHRFNPGNIKADDSYEYLYCQFRCNEVIGSKLVWFDPPHPQTNFRAFIDLDAGVLDYLRFLSQRARYQLAWMAAVKGDPAAFVHALKTSGYFTAPEGPYLRSVVSLFNEYMRLLSRSEASVAPMNEADEHEVAILAVAPDAERLIHNTAVLRSFVDTAYAAVQDDLNRGAAQHQREFDADKDPFSEPNS